MFPFQNKTPLEPFSIAAFGNGPLEEKGIERHTTLTRRQYSVSRRVEEAAKLSSEEPLLDHLGSIENMLAVAQIIWDLQLQFALLPTNHRYQRGQPIDTLSPNKTREVKKFHPIHHPWHLLAEAANGNQLVFAPPFRNK